MSEWGDVNSKVRGLTAENRILRRELSRAKIDAAELRKFRHQGAFGMRIRHDETLTDAVNRWYQAQQATIREREREIYRLRTEENHAGVEVERIRQDFRNLMAVINSDGGHKTDEFDTLREAGEHCKAVVIADRVRIDEMKCILDPPKGQGGRVGDTDYG